MNIRRNDNVQVIAGKDKGKKGRVRFVYPKKHRVLVEGVNFIKMHSRARAQVRQSGIIEREAPLHISNIMLICNRCNQPVRVGFRNLEDNRRVRICRSCNEVID